MQAAITANCPPGVGEDFSGQDLRGRNLWEYDLVCADLTNTDLRGAKLGFIRFGDLDGAIIDETTEMWDTVFVSHQPPESSGSSLFGHTMCEQDGKYLLRSYLDPMRPMSCSNFWLDGMRNAESAIAEHCPLFEGRDYSTIDLSGLDLSGLDLTCADFSFADLRGANLRGSDLSYSVLWGADLTGADLTGASLADAGIEETVLERAYLVGTDLSNTYLELSLFGSDITGANFDGALVTGETTCPDGGYPWAADPYWLELPPEDRPPITCPGVEPIGIEAPFPVEYPSSTHVIGSYPLDVSPVRLGAAWDSCPRVITDEDVTPYLKACIQKYTDAGIVYQTYHTLPWAEAGIAGWRGIVEDYPSLQAEGLAVDRWGDTGFVEVFDGNGWSAPPGFSNGSDAWLDFMIGVIKTQVDAGATGIAIDAGWGNLGPGPTIDFNPQAMAGFRDYLATRYTEEELAAKGVYDVETFDLTTELLATEVFIDYEADPGAYFTPVWWEDTIGRLIAPGETYSRETLEVLPDHLLIPAPIFGLFFREMQTDFDYYNRFRLREIYQRIGDEIRPYAESLGQSWYLAANVYNDLGWHNAAVMAPVLDVPIGELTYGDEAWPDRNFTAFIKNMAALGKRFAPMFWPGQALMPNDDEDTEAAVMFLADLYAAGGVAQYPDRRSDEKVQRFFELIQSDEGFFTQTDNRVGLYYSLGSHMGDVGRFGRAAHIFSGVARLLEDAHHSYDVLYQGGPDMGPGTVRWVEQQVTPADLARYDMVLLPSTVHMTDAEIANLTGWVESGGVLVVFGAVGTHDFDFPVPVQREDPAWSEMVTTPGTTVHADGTVIVFPGDEKTNIAAGYDVFQDPAALKSFLEAVANSFAGDVTTDAGPLVHIHRFEDPGTGREILHLINFDYDPDADVVAALESVAITVRTGQAASDVVVRYHTPDNPAGGVLSATVLDDDRVAVDLPGLHIYGILTFEAG